MWNVGSEMGVYRSTFCSLLQEVHEQGVLGCLARLSFYTHTRLRGKWVIGCVFAIAFSFEWDDGRMDVEMLEEREGGIWDAEEDGLVERGGERVEVERKIGLCW